MGGVDVHACSDYNLSVEKGIPYYMGASGSGKSTMIEYNRLSLTATDGTYKFDGMEVSRFKDDELAE
jgi:ABC-type lipoprotein export system ATPase subunit